MADSFTETTHTTWFQRIGKAFKGIVVGFILFIVAFPLLFWNEGRTIKQTKSLKQTEADLVLAKCDEVNQEFEGKPVYMSGVAKTEETLKDDYFPVTVTGFKLRRNVEMYQWVEEEHTETKRNVGGSEDTVTTYTYKKQWVNHPIDSNSFHESSDHENPSWNFEGGEIEARTGSLGAFTLTESIIGKMTWYDKLVIEEPKAEQPAQQPAQSADATPEEQPAPNKPAAEPAAQAPAAPETPAEEAAPAAEAPAEKAAPAAEEAPATEEAPVAPETPVDDDPFDVPSETTADEAPADAPAAPVTDAAAATTATTEPAVPAQTTAPALSHEEIAAANGVPDGYIYYNGGFYLGNPKRLSVGDVRVTFDYIPDSVTISVISGQQGDTFAPYQTKYNQIELVEKGVVSPDAMFKHAHNANAMLAWILRLVGFLMMFFGLKMIFEPLKVLADVVPFIGTIVGMGTGFIAFILAAGFSLITIAVGWVYYRPLIGIPLLIAGLVFLLMPFFRGKKAPEPKSEDDKSDKKDKPETPFERA